MTKAKIMVGGREYVFEGDNAKDAISSAKYSRVTLKLIREMGLKWTRKLLWPTFKNLHGDQRNTDVGISLPKTFQSMLKKKSEGNLNASLDMNIHTEEFEASASGKFTSEGLSVEFESEIDGPDETGNALREGLDLFSNYNVDVEEIRFDIDNSNGSKKATIDVDASVPSNLSKISSS